MSDSVRLDGACHAISKRAETPSAVQGQAMAPKLFSHALNKGIQAALVRSDRAIQKTSTSQAASTAKTLSQADIQALRQLLNTLVKLLKQLHHNPKAQSVGMPHSGADGGAAPIRFGGGTPQHGCDDTQYGDHRDRMPTMPAVPSAPSHPHAASDPSRPSIPAIPYVPSIPGVPSVPSLPEVPEVPEVPGLPDNEPVPAGQPFSRLTDKSYVDDGSTMAGADRPNPRAISNAVVEQGGERTFADKGASSLLWNWGQFIDHDLGLTRESEEHANIAVPKGDGKFDPQGSGSAEIEFKRAAFEMGPDGKREQINDQTPLMDASMIYGPDKGTEDGLRTFDGGKMKVSDGDHLPVDKDGKVLAGDPRADEQPGLTSLHTLFVREHNRQADLIAKANPGLNDQQIFDAAKRRVTMSVQAITYNEFLPVLLGDSAPVPGKHVPGTEGQISAEFTGAAFRLGHTMVNETLDIRQPDGSIKSVPLREVFMQPGFTKANGIGGILGGLVGQQAEAVDPMIVDTLRNALFGPPGSGGLDLASLNIQRGRDMGLPTYNDMREAMGLKRIDSFNDPIFKGDFGQKLAAVYDHPDQVDLWIGALAEDPKGNSMLGETMTHIVAGQFMATAMADPNFYLNHATPQERAWLADLTLADIIRANTDAKHIDDTAFIATDNTRRYA